MNAIGLAKARLAPLRAALYDYDAKALSRAIESAFAPDATLRLGHPIEDLGGPLGFARDAIGPLAHAMPDFERRDYVVIAGHDASGALWLGCAGDYMGRFLRPFLGVPPTGHLASFRFHEFFRIEEGRIVELQGLWDLPELMLQAGVWPMGPALGREWRAPAPATCDGLGPHDPSRTAASQALVAQMLEHLGKFATGGVEAMRLDAFWHPKFDWYGPSGVGSARAIQGFRDWHQIPFLNGMPDRIAHVGGGGHLFAEGDYVGYTGWPGMNMTLSGDGFLGVAPAGQTLTMRSLDFWRCEGDAIRENWVLIDLLNVWAQLGVDVLARARELAKARRLCEGA